jgi:hypothetical protein
MAQWNREFKRNVKTSLALLIATTLTACASSESSPSSALPALSYIALTYECNASK